MPYNTRRVSLSLPSLGIHVPGHNSRTNAAHRTSPSGSPPTDPNSDHPSKRVKRTHSSSSSSSTASPDPTRSRATSGASASASGTAQTTPPPSPGNLKFAKIDKEGISDDVVVAVLEQLESTGNRPHLIKEFAAVLSHTLKVVEGSANPVAIISSRLTNYMRRPWTALAACPLTKEQVAVHPRRVYYYLATRPRQDIPEYTEAIAAIPANGRVISPASASASSDEEEEERLEEIVPHHDQDETRERDALSPELEFDEFDLPSQYATFAEPEYVVTARSRAQSPPLECDEREFSATASSMQQRKQSEEAERRLNRASDSGSDSSMHSSPAPEDMEYSVESLPFSSDENGESAAALANRDVVPALFGGQSDYTHLGVSQSTLDASFPFSSPVLRPISMSGKDYLSNISPRKTPFVFGAGVDDITMADASFLSSGAGWDMQSPEAVGLNELDDLLGGY